LSGDGFNLTDGSDKHAATAAAALHLARQVDRALPPPVRHQRVQRVDVGGDQGTRGAPGLKGKQAPHPGAQGARQPEQRRCRDALPRTGCAQLDQGVCRQIVERIGVVT